MEKSINQRKFPFWAKLLIIIEYPFPSRLLNVASTGTQPFNTISFRQKIEPINLPTYSADRFMLKRDTFEKSEQSEPSIKEVVRQIVDEWEEDLAFDKEEFIEQAMPFLKESKVYGKYDDLKLLSLVKSRIQIYSEIAEKLGLPLGTVKSRIFFTRQRLQIELKDFR